MSKKYRNEKMPYCLGEPKNKSTYLNKTLTSLQGTLQNTDEWLRSSYPEAFYEKGNLNKFCEFYKNIMNTFLENTFRRLLPMNIKIVDVVPISGSNLTCITKYQTLPWRICPAATCWCSVVTSWIAAFSSQHCKIHCL